LAANSPDAAAPIRPFTLPAAARASNLVAELRWTQDGTTIPVPAGLQVTAKIHGDMPIPPTDPGRTWVRVELVFPLLAKDGRALLLPSGTQLVGLVHLLRGELLFMDFQSCILPDGRCIGLPEDTFHLGPGHLLALQDGTPALLTVARPLRMEGLEPAH
jgi:hypothetical protein